MRKSIAAAVIAASAATAGLRPRAAARTAGRRSRATTRSANSSRSRSPGPMTSRSAPAPTRAFRRSGAAEDARAHGRRGRRATSSSSIPRSNTAGSTAAGPPRQGEVHGDRAAAARRDDRRVGRHQASTRSRATASKATSPGRAASASHRWTSRRSSCRSPARAASRPAPARRRAPNMKSPARATSTPSGVAAAAGQGVDRRLGQRHGQCHRHRRRRHHGLGRRRRDRRRQVQGQQGRARATSAALKAALNHAVGRWAHAHLPPSPPSGRAAFAAPAGAATRNFGITGFDEGPGRGPVQGPADDRRRAVRAGDRLARGARPGRDRSARRHAGRPQRTVVVGRLSRAGRRAGRDRRSARMTSRSAWLNGSGRARDRQGRRA